MRRKERPIIESVCHISSSNFGASPKRPPSEGLLRGVVHPVGFDPIDDIVVAGQQHALAACPLPGLLESQRPELGNLPVHNRRELDRQRFARASR